MEMDTGAFHEVGTVVSPDDGPSHLDVGCSRSSIGRTAGQWLVDTNIYPHAACVDVSDPDKFCAGCGRIIPESAWEMTPEQALAVADLYRRAAEQAMLFQSMESGD
jgi:predicted Fe-S protein YdhL (DUF1289 family)